MNLTKNEIMTMIEAFETSNACLYETWAYLPKEWSNPLMDTMFERTINNTDAMLDRLKKVVE